MSADLTINFNECVKHIKDGEKFAVEPSNGEKLKMYALFKQVNEGDVNIGPPSLFSSGLSYVLLKSKWEAWNDVKGMTKDDAMQAYIDLFNTMKNRT